MKKLIVKAPSIVYSLCLVVIALALNGCATVSEKKGAEPVTQVEEQPKIAEQLSIEEKWGIKILSISQTAAGYMLDFRYRILDPDKASVLAHPKYQANLIDQASGRILSVPVSPKVGSLRGIAKHEKPKANRNYYVLFMNPNKFVKPGNKVTVIIGDFKVKDMVVE